MELDMVPQDRRAQSRFWGIRTKVLALVILSALLPTVLVGTSSYWTARSALTDKLSEQLNTKASLAAAKIFEWFQERSLDARVFASSGIVVANVERHNAGSRSGRSLVRDYLEEVLGRYEVYSSLLVLDHRRALLASAGSPAGENVSFVLESAPDEVGFFEFRPEGASLWLRSPILGTEGKTVGWLVLGCSLDTLREAIAAHSSTDRLHLTSIENRLILAHPPGSFSAEAIPEQVPGQGSMVDFRDPRGVWKRRPVQEAEARPS